MPATNATSRQPLLNVRLDFEAGDMHGVLARHFHGIGLQSPNPPRDPDRAVKPNAINERRGDLRDDDSQPMLRQQPPAFRRRAGETGGVGRPSSSTEALSRGT